MLIYLARRIAAVLRLSPVLPRRDPFYDTEW